MLQTARLLLRPLCAADLPAFAEMNADPRVAAWFLAAQTHAESEEMLARMTAVTTGLTPWAIEVAGVTRFAGFAGLWRPTYDVPFAPCVEIAWRLHPDHWGRGYASEAARAALADGFRAHGLDEIVSFTLPQNTRSRRVMEAIGMRRDPAEDFDHPRVPEGHPFRRHVLYRIGRRGDPLRPR